MSSSYTFEQIQNSSLTDREKDILFRRYGLNGYEKQTQRQIGEKCGLTKDGVRYIQEKAEIKMVRGETSLPYTFEQIQNSSLTDREKDILFRRYGLNGYEKQTQRQIGERYGLVQARIFRIQRKAEIKIVVGETPSPYTFEQIQNSSLTDREKDILFRRYGLNGYEKQTQSQVSGDYYLTRESIGRIQRNDQKGSFWDERMSFFKSCYLKTNLYKFVSSPYFMLLEEIVQESNQDLVDSDEGLKARLKEGVCRFYDFSVGDLDEILVLHQNYLIMLVKDVIVEKGLKEAEELFDLSGVVRKVLGEAVKVTGETFSLYNFEQIQNSSLTDREKDIICRRLGLNGYEKQTLKEIGEEHDLSKEMIRKIQMKIRLKMGWTKEVWSSLILIRRVRGVPIFSFEQIQNSSLTDREKDILFRRYGLNGYGGQTLKEISEDCDLKEERVYYLQKRAEIKIEKGETHPPYNFEQIQNSSLTDREKDILFRRYGLNGYDKQTQEQIGEIYSLTRNGVGSLQKRAEIKIEKGETPPPYNFEQIQNSSLTDREKDILFRRYGLNGYDKQTQEQIGKVYGLARPSIGHIQRNAERKILDESM